MLTRPFQYRRVSPRRRHQHPQRPSNCEYQLRVLKMDQHQVDVWENTYIMAPKDDEKFLPSRVTEVIEQVMTEYLKDKEYTVDGKDDAKVWTLEVCNDIKTAIKEKCNIPRYKIIVQVVISENGGQGMRVSSKSLWDVSSDNWASASYSNQSLCAVGMVFGCYFDEDDGWFDLLVTCFTESFSTIHLSTHLSSLLVACPSGCWPLSVCFGMSLSRGL